MLVVNSLQLLKSSSDIPEVIKIWSQIENPNADEIKMVLLCLVCIL